MPENDITLYIILVVEHQPLFCSEKCRDEHLDLDEDHEGIHEFENMHELEIDESPAARFATSMILAQKVFLKIYDAFGGSVENMRTFVESHEKVNYNFFDLDWSMSEDDQKFQENLLLFLMSSKGLCGKNEALARYSKGFCPYLTKSRLIRTRLMQYDEQNAKFMDLVYNRIQEVFGMRMLIHPIHCANSVFAIVCHPAMYAFYTISTASCDPNTFTHHENHAGQRKVVLTVSHPIAAGERVEAAGTLYFRNQKCNKPAQCTPCRERWADLLDENQLFRDFESQSNAFYKRNDPKKIASVLQHRQLVCDFINKNFTGYYKNPKIRQKIASKKEELRMNLNYVGCLMPSVGSFMGREFFDNAERYMIPEVNNTIAEFHIDG